MKILYICTHNRCRSILSEAITQQLGEGRIQAYSAGSQPVGEVHPLSLKYLAERGYAIEGLQSQSWDDFEAVAPDVVVTVCDSAAAEQCPVWFGRTIKLHWGLQDPSKLEGSEADIREAFFRTIDLIEGRVKQLLALDLDNLSQEALATKLAELTRP